MLEDVYLDRNVFPSAELASREEIQPLEADDSTFDIFDQDDIIADFLANRLFSWIIEPDRDRVAGPVVVNS